MNLDIVRGWLDALDGTAKVDPDSELDPVPRQESYIEMVDRMAAESSITFTQHGDGTLTLDCTPENLRVSPVAMENIRQNRIGARSYHDAMSGGEYITLGVPYAAEYEVLGVSSDGPWYVCRLVKTAEEGDWNDDQVEAHGE